MEKLLKIPYFARAYDEDGYTRAEYNTHPALVKTARGLLQGHQRDGRLRRRLPQGQLKAS